MKKWPENFKQQGSKNIRGIAHCMTRLRLTLHDESKVNMDL